MISGIPVFTMRRFLPKLGALGGNADAKLWDDLEELDFHAFWGVAKRLGPSTLRMEKFPGKR